MNIKDEFLKAISDDPFGLTIVKPKVSANKDESKIVIEKFMKILEFYEKNKKEPAKEASREERTLAIILESIRNDKNQKSVVKHLDIYALLKDDLELVTDVDVEKIESLDDDPFGLLGDESLDYEDIFTLKNVSKTLEMPDYIATRKVCKDFFKYEELFKNLQKDLQNKLRKIEEHKGERFIQKGLFFVLKGVVGYVADVGKLQKQNNKINARLKCIFENGTQSDMLLRSLSAELYKDGQVISFLNEEIEDNLSQIQNEDKTSGYIYLLKSKSNDNQIRDIRNLYKIGYSTTKVDERLRNAKNEPTYLMAEVEQIAIYKCFNMNTQKLEQILHQFFGKSCLNIEIIGNDGKSHTPREWFIAPLEVIKQAIFMIVSGEIIYYKYDEKNEFIKPI
ncbi:hypothetical protein CJ671_08150 [Aliarcobacter cryaerophilus]|uniref:Bacteriophage T5 Orf172 DNA-binding domain-containing protein n=1 Tax=Aliarcobacter cryaerophilus TaxID=28198 RepID=A0A2S9SQK7_9BACT|nr:GIY-YIG nuclease family protein [Aliarcobacter cryaerophilus]PRM88870.1 hypothetical protein CJ671_08150 [Aliarcobacter cryaerophilus]